jgi:hypothetical protein
MKLHDLFLGAAVAALLSSPALAGDCALRVDRQPWPGKQVGVHGPCGNRNPTVENGAGGDLCR